MSLSPNATIWLYAHPTMEKLAEKIMRRVTEVEDAEEKFQEDIGKPHITQGQEVPRRKIELKKSIRWKTFPDGFPNLFIEEVKTMAGKDVIFLGSFHSAEVIFEQLSIVYALPRYLARSLTFILPYFPTATMERVEMEGEIATAKTLSTMLSCIPLCSRGPPHIMVFDIHALQERFYFGNSVIPRLETAIPLLQREVQSLPDHQNISIAFPDDGAHKRFHRMFDKMNTIICVKVREGDKRVIRIKDGNPKDQHVVIVDDLVMTGGTLKECGKALMNQGAKCISAYVTHAVFPSDSWKKFTQSDVKFENFWITDSMPHANDIAKHEPFRLLSICDVIADSLLGYDLLQN
ncbi:ribose-phosphate pyrophosphokinase 4 [Lingula anatina]|uniref:Ribose-phosphate pyrophosphokinase 4 n=1 Tax=Lingula anatina TaxID=7574 RepID=A0A1S3KAJ8_LINAN|nr:ribose-phosphate pyrophosphokinase 4 [Lingula anatina]|eukprot:XP_013419663.1 ribose-phosphate pyrophosphokinase 4 [Lingula anatina]